MTGDACSRAQQALIAAALILPALLFSTAAADPVNVVKLTALVICAVALLATAACDGVVTRQARLPWGVPAVAGVALLGALVLATVLAPATSSAVVGEYGRNSGLLAYTAALVLFLTVLRFDRGGARIVLYALMVAGGLTASYGLLQYLGLDAIDWNSANPVIASLGNPNFAAAYVAICLPAFVWAALQRRLALGWRVAAAAGAVLCLLVALLSQSAQGPLAASAGLAVLGAAWLLNQPERLRRGGLAVLTGLAVLGVAVLAWGAAGGGPAARIFDDIGARARGWFWQAAIATWRDHPVLGVGLENFAPFWLRERSLEAVRGLGAEDVTDAAHSVPLHLLTTGGLVLLIAYLVFMAVAATALVSGLRRLRGDERVLLGALGGCWAAYQVQSFVSIDQVPLLVTHFVLAGAVIVAAGRARVRLVHLTGTQQEVPRPARRRGPARSKSRRRLTPLDHGLLVGVTVLAAVLAWLSLLPLRANMAARAGDVALGRGDGTPALAEYRRATRLLAGEPVYWERLGRLLLRAKEPEQALQAYRRGMEADPSEVTVVRGAARAAAEAGQPEVAREYHSRALELHPYSPSTTVAAADFEFQQGRPEQASSLLDSAVRLLPEEASLWAALGGLRAAQGDTEAARAALRRALALDPQVAGAAERLQALDAAAS